MNSIFLLLALVLAILLSAFLISKKRSVYGLDFILIFFCLYLLGGKMVLPAIESTFSSGALQIVMLVCFYVLGAIICLLAARALSKVIG